MTAVTSTPPRRCSTRCTLRRHLGADLDGRADRDRRRHPAFAGRAQQTRLRSRPSAREVTLVAPPTLLPPSLDGWPVAVSHDLDAVLPDADVVYLLRIQHERRNASLFPRCASTPRATASRSSRAAQLRKDVLVMHPGPMNRGVEIAAEVAEGPASLITEQVTNGVAVRMAVLYSLLGQEVALA